MKNEINITSTALEKGFEIAKDFLDKLIMPAVEETGLLMREKVTYWKFKNQVKMLNKAKSYCSKHNIEPKAISFKLLVPLLETSALEEDEILQDKWAILLSNMVDSEQNVENHVFPYILGQISKNEFLFLEQVLLSKNARTSRLNNELSEFKTNLPKITKEFEEKINKLNDKIAAKKEEQKQRKSSPFNREIWDIEREKSLLELEVKMLPYKESRFERQIAEPEIIPEEELEKYEVSNLIRLGLIKEVQETIANSQTLEIPKHDEHSYSEYVSVDVDIELESNTAHILTELGELFVQACSEKKVSNTTEL